MMPRDKNRGPAWRRYLRFWGQDRTRDLDDELRFHLDARYEEFVDAGMTPAQARAEVDRRFGNVRSVREQCATIDSRAHHRQSLIDWLGSAVADTRHATRQLSRNATISVAAIICFALGIGATTAIYSIVDAVLFRPLPFLAPDQLALIGDGLPSISNENFGVISAPEFSDYRRLDGRFFKSSAIYEPKAFALSGSGEPERVTGLIASASMFPTLGVSAVRGRTFSTADEGVGHPDVVLLSDALWHRRYSANPDIVGRSIDVDGKPMTVVGVLPRSFRFPLPGVGGDPADLIVPFRMTEAVKQQRANSYDAWMLVRLLPGVSLDGARRAVADIAANLPRVHPESYSVESKTVADIRPLRDQAVTTVRKPLLIVMGAVIVVLLIACLNVSSLLLARAAARQREISVRRALGASRMRLVQQFLAESVTLVVIGGGLGVALAVWGARAVAAHAPREVLQGYDASIDMRVLVATGAVLLVTTLVFSLVPAIQQSRNSPAATLRSEARGSTPGHARQRGRRTLVVAEISLALVLATAASLMVRSFVFARAVDPGFDAVNVLTFRVGLPATRYAAPSGVLHFGQALTDRLRSIPGVRFASATSNLPMTTPRRFAVWPEGATTGKGPLASIEFVLPDYFDAIRVQRRAGRLLDAGDVAGGLPAVVVNQTLARKFFGDRGAVGRRIKWGGQESTNPWLTIVGVTADVKTSGLDQPSEPQVYFPALQQDSATIDVLLRGMTYVVRTVGDPTTLMTAVRQVVREVDPTLPIVALQPMTSVVSISVTNRRFNTMLLAAFALLALTLAAVGIYGVIAYSVVQRRREIGVRLALGATPGDVLRLIVGQGAQLAMVGVGIGLVVSVAVSRVLRSLLFDVSPFDPVAFGGAVIVLLAVAILSSYVPARRAARIDPQDAIRIE